MYFCMVYNIQSCANYIGYKRQEIHMVFSHIHYNLLKSSHVHFAAKSNYCNSCLQYIICTYTVSNWKYSLRHPISTSEQYKNATYMYIKDPLTGRLRLIFDSPSESTDLLASTAEPLIPVGSE